MSSNQGVFHDLLVVEIASVLAGPSVGQFFAEMGATVIKLENIKTNGDVTRSWKLSSETNESTISAYFTSANWGKKSVCADLSAPVVQQAIFNIIKKADVVLASFKPGDAEKLKMDFATLSALNPRLLYGHITGYGLESARAGYDAVLQAEAGFMYLNGEPDGGPLKMPVALIDVLAAHQLKEGLLAALYWRERTGQGKYVEVSLLRTAISSLANQATNYLVAGNSPKRMGSEHPNIVPYGTVFTSADGKELVLAIGNDRQFRRLCQTLGAPELAESPKYKNNKARVRHRSELKTVLTELVAKWERENLLAVLQEQHVPAGAVYSVTEALSQANVQPQLLKGENYKGLRQISFSLDPAEEMDLSGPPRLGEHTWPVLRKWAGMTEEELLELAQNQLICPELPEKG